jgi:hypothetical protein
MRLQYTPMRLIWEGNPGKAGCPKSEGHALSWPHHGRAVYPDSEVVAGSSAPSSLVGPRPATGRDPEAVRDSAAAI